MRNHWSQIRIVEITMVRRHHFFTICNIDNNLFLRRRLLNITKVIDVCKSQIGARRTRISVCLGSVGKEIISGDTLGIGKSFIIN